MTLIADTEFLSNQSRLPMMLTFVKSSIYKIQTTIFFIYDKIINQMIKLMHSLAFLNLQFELIHLFHY